MAKVHNGGFTAGTGFKRTESEPLRDDEVWQFLEDLKTLDNPYPMMPVGVLETKMWYYWNGEDQTDLDNWKPIGEEAPKHRIVGNGSPNSSSYLTDADNNARVLIDRPNTYVAINETHILNPDFYCEITSNYTGNSAVYFFGDVALLEANSLKDNHIVFTEPNMSVIVFKNAQGKFCWRVLNGESPLKEIKEKVNRTDDIKEVSTDRDITKEDASGVVYLESAVKVTIPYISAIGTNKVFNFWVNSFAVAPATIHFDNSLVGEDGNTNIPDLVLNAGSKIVILIKKDGKLCISDN